MIMFVYAASYPSANNPSLLEIPPETERTMAASFLEGCAFPQIREAHKRLLAASVVSQMSSV